MNSSDVIAYLPPNCFLVSVIDPEGPTSSELLEPVISTFFASLMKNTKRISKNLDQRYTISSLLSSDQRPVIIKENCLHVTYKLYLQMLVVDAKFFLLLIEDQTIYWDRSMLQSRPANVARLVRYIKWMSCI